MATILLAAVAITVTALNNPQRLASTLQLSHVEALAQTIDGGEMPPIDIVCASYASQYGHCKKATTVVCGVIFTWVIKCRNSGLTTDYCTKDDEGWCPI